MYQQPPMRKPITVATLTKMKRACEKFTVLTAYDASFATLMESAGVEVLLVGDSLGMVIQGQRATVAVTMDDMIYHTRNVARGCTTALLMADMPFASYANVEQAVWNAARLMQEGGAHIVKLEGGGYLADTVRHLSRNGIPVCVHLGLLPQSVHKLGGYKVQGREEAAAQQIIDEALLLQDAGADVALVECVPAALAGRLRAALDIPLIGIGAGADCDAQVLVCYDMLGITPGRRPKFSKDFLQGQDSIAAAVAAYVAAVKSGTFPSAEHCIA